MAMQRAPVYSGSEHREAFEDCPCCSGIVSLAEGYVNHRARRPLADTLARRIVYGAEADFARVVITEIRRYWASEVKEGE